LATKVDLRRSSIPLKTRWNRFPRPLTRLVTRWAEQIFIALDPAASEFYDCDQKLYVFKKSGGAKKTAEELMRLLRRALRAISDRFHRGRLR